MSTFRVRSMAIVLLAASAALPAFAGGPQPLNHSWGGYHWARTANPFTLKLGNNLTTSDWNSHLSQTSADWNRGTLLKNSVVAGGSNKRCSMVVGTTQVCNGTYGNNGWLGLASINLQSGTLHITQGSAKMNDTYFNTATYNNPNEREHVMCQEVAHTFGLDHQSTDGSSQNSCMDYFSNTGANAGSTLSTQPNQHDFDELNTIYAHLDTTTTVGGANNSGLAPLATSADDNDEIGETPETWGRVIDASIVGRTTTYQKDLANGDTIVTFVIWATKGDVDVDRDGHDGLER